MTWSNILTHYSRIPDSSLTLPTLNNCADYIKFVKVGACLLPDGVHGLIKREEWWPWVGAASEDGLHLLPCLHGHMCFFTDNPLAHPSFAHPLPPESHFLLPACSQPVWAFSDMVILLPGERRLPPPSCFPAHMAPPGSGQRPRRQDLNSKNAFLHKAVKQERDIFVLHWRTTAEYKINENHLNYAKIFTKGAFWAENR